jgi:hypothetical protein
MNTFRLDEQIDVALDMIDMKAAIKPLTEREHMA